MVTDRRSNRWPDKNKEKHSIKDNGFIFDRLVGPWNNGTFALLVDHRA